jgi:signal transduction histidine kinase
VDLRDLARDVSELFRASAQAKSLSLTTTIASDVPLTLFTDRFRLKQILNNLLSNAIKFTLSGAVELAIKPSPEGSHVLFHVIDTGPGIAPAKHEIVFEKFSQANARISYQHGGTGLGLSLSRGLAQLLGGTLNVESSLGKGSKFTLSLPCHGAFHG